MQSLFLKGLSIPSYSYSSKRKTNKQFVVYDLVWSVFERVTDAFAILHMSNEKNPGCLVYIGGYTTQLYRDCNKPL